MFTDPDIDLYDITLNSIVRYQNEFIITFTPGRGHGTWNNTTITTVTSGHITTGLPGTPTPDFPNNPGHTIAPTLIEDILTRWRDNQTSLRLTSKPGEPFYLAANGTNWIALPRA